MLTECFLTATETVKPPIIHLSSNLKDIGVFIHEFQPQLAVRQGFKKSSIAKNCLAFSETHVFAAQAGKAVVNIYSREKNNQEATVPFPQKISSIAYARNSAILILGLQDGRLMLWETATGRISTSSASHIELVTLIEVSPCGEFIISASPDSSIHVWSLSRLVSIATSGTTYGSRKSAHDPTTTFQHHRSAIMALAIGHSQQASSNVVASASEDKICYLWNLESLTILRTVLLQQSPLCAIFDPVDRAVYLGSEDGSVQMIDILEGGIGPSTTSILSTSSRNAITATQLDSKYCWQITGSSNADPAQCISISYDGTSLISGHYSGCLIEWDVGKRRMARQLSSLTGQSVTNIQMLQPVGFNSGASKARFIVPNVIKPRLELSQGQESQSDASSVPADYVFHARVLRNERGNNDTITRILRTSETPQTLLDDAVQAILASNVSRSQTRQLGQAGQANGNVQHADDMQKELVALRAKLAKREESDRARLEKHMERMKRREDVGIQKRQAFFAAKQQGKNGDEAMKSFTVPEHDIDRESEEESIAKISAAQTDVLMKDE